MISDIMVPAPREIGRRGGCLSVCDRLGLRDWLHLAPALQAIEGFNGLGYQRPGGPPSPYLWAGTTLERPGKFVADGRFDPTAHDAQLGCAAILKRMQARGIALRFVQP